ncbi:hypothetical protein SAMN05444392_12118 [Seinonella peptonophila]|uniref:Uncharacterized protein n=1 Tax=Seinonella peptonophila TaxID=112248 RepID=A0A1M5BD95_9BACL|nr:hypothetical protein [Seinonella peptonophila]SHF40297.1 hypothetical protein SAMN05444392_12118 [Seinonella peptonophila]
MAKTTHSTKKAKKEERDFLTGELEKDLELLIKLRLYKFLDTLLDDDNEKMTKIKDILQFASTNHFPKETRKKWRKAINRNFDLNVKRKEG